MIRRMQVDHNGLEVLAEDECLRLLGTRTLGRIGVTSDALPLVLPVSFWFDGNRILVRTTHGSKLDNATRNAVVAFEVDELDPVDHTGWSVVVRGVASHVASADTLGVLSAAPIPRWASNGSAHAIAIAPELVSGRRIGWS
jgi:uncharacterized protein